VQAVLLAWLKAVHVAWSFSVCQIRVRTKLFAEKVLKLSNAFFSIG
jgi:hypothetical protein